MVVKNSSELTKRHHTLYQTHETSKVFILIKLAFDTAKPEAYPIASVSIVGRSSEQELCTVGDSDSARSVENHLKGP